MIHKLNLITTKTSINFIKVNGKKFDEVKNIFML